MINLEKKINLVKEVLAKNNIGDEHGQVVLALDISMSMDNLFRNGTVQSLVERLLAIGVNMDLDKQIDVHLFGQKAHIANSANLKNIDGYVQKEIINKYNLEGSTYYAGVMKNIAKESGNDNVLYMNNNQQQKGGFLSKLFKSTPVDNTPIIVANEEKKEPTIVFFITDGDNFDKPETTEIIKKLSSKGIFWQFIGIGDASFSFLRSLDDMDGRYIDNANFFAANDINRISDEELYERILGELPEWLKEARSKNIII